eukprot:2252059-Pyramimonas_sp.AAC.1
MFTAGQHRFSAAESAQASSRLGGGGKPARRSTSQTRLQETAIRSGTHERPCARATRAIVAREGRHEEQ